MSYLLINLNPTHFESCLDTFSDNNTEYQINMKIKLPRGIIKSFYVYMPSVPRTKGPRKLLGPKREEVTGQRKSLALLGINSSDIQSIAKSLYQLHDWLTIRGLLEKYPTVFFYANT